MIKGVWSYIESITIGYGKRQDEPYLCNYTVPMDCKFGEENPLHNCVELPEMNNIRLAFKFIACTDKFT
jgi:hypothetical protein